MKVCGKCREEKPGSEFGKDSRTTTGLKCYCRPCEAAQRRIDRAKNPEAARAVSAKWRAANPEKVRAYTRANREANTERMRKWRAANPERDAENSRRYREANRDRILESTKRWQAKYPERVRAVARESMAKNRANKPEDERKRKRRYRERHLDKVRAMEREKTYSRRQKMPYSKETAEYMAMLVTLPCTYCGSTDRITIDHIVPLSRGGKHEPEILTPACWTCNCSKGARLLDEWPGPPRSKAA